MTMKLYYFDIRGLAEPIRYLLKDQGASFEDIQFQKNEEWFELKKKMIFGQVPCLMDGDLEIVQSGAILRHLARKYDLAGTTEEEKTFVDLFHEGVKDLHMKYTKMIYNEYEKKEEFLANVYPVEWAVFEKLIQKHAKGEKFVLGDKVSYADYMLYEELDIALILSSTCLDAFPVLKAYHARFGERPAIKGYTSTRSINVNNNGKQ